MSNQDALAAAVSPAMRERITQAIATLEVEQGIRVLYAAESGSRAWGFASPDSDYDVRLVYAHPPEWYVRIDAPRDVVEVMLPGDVDLSGWDVRKALQLYAGCNLALCEWLDSPIVYVERGPLAARLGELQAEFFRPAHALFHYLNTARSTRRAQLSAPRVRLKKMFYALRPLLACRWIEHQRCAPPTAFAHLLDAPFVSASERAAIAELQRLKATATEADLWTMESYWSTWLDQQEAHFEAIGPSLGERHERPIEALNTLLREVIVQWPA